MHRRANVAILILLAAAAPCLGDPAASEDTAPASCIFVESWPEQTGLDLPDLADAPDVWREVIAGAEGRIDIASFYFSRQGDGQDTAAPAGLADHLRPVLDEVARAAAERNVPVRVLADAKFARTYPEGPAWLGDVPGIEVSTFALDEAHGGGILHAKYFLVDDQTCYLGSQNWDWRALSQIHELGVLLNHRELTAQLRSIFDYDWRLAAGEDLPVSDPQPVALADLTRYPVTLAGGAVVEGLIAASPAAALPVGIAWDLPLLIEMIDGAADSVHVQLLSFGETDREKRLFDDLDRALRRAAVRGAQVRMILANWSKSKYNLPWIQALARIPGIEIRFTNIPEHRAGFIPFARVEHAKYLTVDGRALWIGTSNWSRDYFHGSRNVGLILVGKGAPGDPDRFFNLSWHGPYAEPVDPCGSYQPPRRQ